jgi:annexin A7/11
MYPDEPKCMKDAKDLYQAGEGQWGSDESVFNKIFSIRSPYEMSFIALHYQKLSGKTLMESIENEFSGDFKKCLKTIVQAMINPSAFFASRIHDAIKGWGTNDELLIRVLVSRDEIDMPQIKQAYKMMFGNDMLEDIKDDTSGDYKNLLVEIASH